MAPTKGSFSPNAEVDELRWLPLEEGSRFAVIFADQELIAVLMAADQVEPVI